MRAIRPQTPNQDVVSHNGHDGSPDPLLLAPDPISWHIAHQTRHNLGSLGYYLP